MSKVNKTIGVSGEAYGPLVDPSISSVIWDLMIDEPELRHGGVITRRDGTRERFSDFELVRPYLEAWRLRRDELIN